MKLKVKVLGIDLWAKQATILCSEPEDALPAEVRTFAQNNAVEVLDQYDNYRITVDLPLDEEGNVDRQAFVTIATREAAGQVHQLETLRNRLAEAASLAQAIGEIEELNILLEDE